MLLTDIYNESAIIDSLRGALSQNTNRIHIKGLSGSLTAVLGASLSLQFPDRSFLFLTTSKEDAYYLQNDLETLLNENGAEIDNKRVLLFPTTYRRPYQTEETDNANVLMRSEVVKQLNSGRAMVIVSYPEAMAEKVVSPQSLNRNMLSITKGARFDMDFVIDVLQEYNFDRVDFVVQPGQFAVRGGIIDVYSYANENPFRIEFFDDTIDSLRTFDPVSQLSLRHHDQVSIIPNLESANPSNNIQFTNSTESQKVSLLNYFSSDDIVWAQGLMYCCETIEKCHATAKTEYDKIQNDKAQGIVRIQNTKPNELYSSANDFIKALINCRVIESGNSYFFTSANSFVEFETHSEPQPSFNKQFDLLKNSLSDYFERGYQLFISVSSEQQRRRLDKVFEHEDNFQFSIFDFQLFKGFIDHDQRLICYTDHEIFERYHKYTVRDLSQNREALTLKELFELKPGDYVTHIDYGVGRFSGLEKIETNGHQQEVIRLVYKNNDTLYISIHGLHKISRYVGKDGVTPTLNRLGSNTWQLLKQKTKKQVKDIAKDLIQLYAKRKATLGFAFSADSYLQNELEASFMYEDTPDQLKATIDVKHDMESQAPMDRLVCGDVGFGKTEVAIRAAFKAVCDSKQVAVLVPSTILAFQHYNTFTERLKGLPVNIDYLNRFRTTKERNQIIRDLENGKIDILIGTHAITNSKLKFKDLGLLIIDEEQKFGVSIKEKLKQMRTNVDVLTLTATPIPRTLQFSLMGARDLSVIQTPPPNRQPIQTDLLPFSEEVIRDAISYELSRDGQVFFISNRVENLPEMAGLVSRLVPDAVVAIAHGQMEGRQVEDTMMRFIEGEIDVLVATAIIENGLDIPNANTMIINNAQQFGLSDLHQMRGRVGRSNRKAFCYMLIPSFSVLTDEAQKRLRAIEEFASVGSGFNIAMRDLDIRGAGNILGAEQSGFISEIGYDMYHKILNEALEELKETEFQELFAPQETAKPNQDNAALMNATASPQPPLPTTQFVKECLIETDLEVLIPDDYVSNIGERLQLYKELNDLATESELDQYRERLIDRFGPIPVSTQELINTISLRRMAKDFGIEKIVLKQNKMVCYFVANQNNPFYQSANFTQLIKYAQDHPRSVHLRETTERLSLVCDNVDNISSAMEKIKTLISAF
ncbi:MAG: transcription-repair coupling factor [Bacteroidales bacterium]|nr:transcription-repair coupling factor [Bacteroidales bacterium]